ncbi:hypothetical protein R5R35_004273 [Gryllus longicercus]|uniref:Uncharacterized protein n=1 Tax=Gryllus longicercus TaxID=2509291 RepID=A0AAN9W1N5_9ORTH
MSYERTLWMQFVREIPQLKEWLNYGFVSVGHKIYILGYSDKTDRFEVLIFDAKNYSLRSVDFPDQSENSSVPALKSFFAVSHSKKIYICGSKSPNSFAARHVHCLDTETMEWTDTDALGDIPQGKMWGAACVVGNKIYICIDYFVNVSEGKPRMYALDLRTKIWTCQCRHTWSLRLTPRGTVAFGRRIYVLFIKWTNIGDNNDCIGCYDTSEGSWRWLDPPGSSTCFGPSWTIFDHGEDVYILLSDVFMMATERLVYPYSDEDGHEKIFLKYSTRRDQWGQVKYKGSPPGRQFDSVIVIEDKVFLFCSIYKEAYMLDFFPSLRSLSLEAVNHHELDIACLPAGLKNEILQSTTHSASSK